MERHPDLQKKKDLDVQYLMLRAFFLPGKVTPEQSAFYVDLLKKVAPRLNTDYMEKQALKPIFSPARTCSISLKKTIS